MKAKWTYRTFCVIWLLMACIFAVLAYESYQASSTSLSRFSCDIPEDRGGAKLWGVDLGSTLNEMSETNNKNIAALELSIRHSGKLTLWLNLISFFMAISGLVAQIYDHRYSNREQTEK